MATMFFKQAERIAIYAGVAAALFFGVAAQRDVGKAIAQPSPQVTVRIATADILNIAERLMATEKYKSARDTLANTYNKDIAAKLDVMKDVKSKFDALPEAAKAPESTDATALDLSNRFRTLQQELNQKQNDAQAQIEKFNTTQVIEAYKLIAEGASELATSLGYTHMIATRSGSFDIRSQNLTGAVQEILARPVLKGPIGDDLTDRLLKQYNLENVAVPQAPGATPSASSTPATGK
ncbi:MAG: hypothetical protein WC718_06815 [Phycisphaerales bacterium]|jgi:Skp family chaperone for outer membrane proteins